MTSTMFDFSRMGSAHVMRRHEAPVRPRAIQASPDATQCVESPRRRSDNVGQLSDLEALRLWNCETDEIPYMVWHMQGLETLDLYHSARIESIPDAIGGLTRLRFLRLSHCRSLKSISDEIGRLSSLQTLDLSHCEKLEQLPKTVARLRALCVLDLRGCARLQQAPAASELPSNCTLRLPEHLRAPLAAAH